PVEHINDSSKIAVCSSYKDLRLCKPPPNIVKTSLEIENVLMHYRC
ncbi:5926_t:CDS:1, partial [Funneliformis caledonium]